MNNDLHDLFPFVFPRGNYRGKSRCFSLSTHPLMGAEKEKLVGQPHPRVTPCMNTVHPDKPAVVFSSRNRRIQGGVIPLKESLITESKSDLSATRKAKLALKTRTPEEWRYAIDTISDPVIRVQAACIVWWDYFSSRLVSQRWPHLDAYRDAWTVEMILDQPQLELALLKLGYPLPIARIRSTLPSTSQKMSARHVN